MNEEIVNQILEEEKLRKDDDSILSDLGDEMKEVEKFVTTFLNKEDLASQILNLLPMHYDESGLWWVWKSNESKWIMKDDIDVLNFVRHISPANTINSKEKNEILESLRQESRMRKPEPVASTVVQFDKELIDISNGKRFKASPKYFITNPIPHKLGHTTETPNMDRIFAEWVGEEYVKTLYEILAYSILPDYPINRIFCFIGAGMNGKSCYLNLLRKFVGQSNCCATELDTLLASRFEVTRLHKKLVCQMGETNFNEMSKTSLLKKLSGGDLIGFEYKNKTPFDEKNYAKIIIATNNLPSTTDKTIGFYRRWMIIDFPNSFSEKKDILLDIPEEEYNALAMKCVGILVDLLSKREFHKEGSVEERMKKYEDHSNPLEKFMRENVDEDCNGFIWKWEYEKFLNDWCKSNRFREISNVAIGKKMKELHIEQEEKSAGGFSSGKRWRAWVGIKWKNDQIPQLPQDSQAKSTQFSYVSNKLKLPVEVVEPVGMEDFDDF